MKKLVILILSLILSFATFTLVACGGEDYQPHEHNYSETYAYNSLKHWRACECGEFMDWSEHVDVTEDGKCDVCSYVMFSVGTHEHSFGANYLFDERNHWKECACGETTSLEAHTNSDNDGKCDVCSYQMVEEHVHNFSVNYYNDETNHWKECACGETTSLDAHTNSDSDGKCDVCSYQMEEVHVHSFGSDYLTNENNHWKECACGEISLLEPHSDANNDAKCDACLIKMVGHVHIFNSSYSYSTAYHWRKCACGQTSTLGSHYDTNYDGRCDACSYKTSTIHSHSFGSTYYYDQTSHWRECSCGEQSYLGSHIDSNSDGKCDTCLYQMKIEHSHNFGSTYYSDETSHWKKCACGEQSYLGSHIDSNSDGYCDTCLHDLRASSTQPEIQAPQTPVIPGHPTSGDSSYLGKTAIEIYSNAMAVATATGNYTFNAYHDIDISLVVPAGTQLPSGYDTTLGYQTMDSVYCYANGEFFGREEVVANLMGDVQTIIAEIVCVDNVVYLLAQENNSIQKIKDNGSYNDLQNSTNIPLDITDNRLYVPSVNALSNAYFNLSSDGATLTVKLSGTEAEEFIEDINKNQQDFLFSDIVYIVHFDENGNLLKINYLFQIYVEYTAGMYFCYDYDCVVTITDVNSTVVNAPSDPNSYTQYDFI